MTPEEQRIAIAEACGWLDCEYIESLGLCKGKHKEARIQYDSGHSAVPDYLNDLNAMHEARKTIVTAPELKVKYLNALRAIVAKRCPKNKTGMSLVSDYDLLNADAEEHAEALLKTLNLWKL